MGYRFYLGHEHTPCPSSGSATRAIIVIDDNGVHRVSVQFCSCVDDAQCVEDYRQLLHIGWYPASFRRPKTAFTFNVLDSYHKIVLQGKLNLYDFYLSILQKTDNCGRKKAVVSPVFFSIGVSLMRVVLVSISRDDTMCSPMEKSEANQTRRWRPLGNRPGVCPGRCVCP